jgi:glycosyltransferase involved in cell wall biosynthesis
MQSKNEQMKTIILIPVKNEEWILGDTLLNLAPHVDFVIIADQKSTDKTVEIAKGFANVRVIDNTLEGHSNAVRWLLLDEARKLVPNDDRLIICVDADEMISPKAIDKMLEMAAEGKAVKGDVFRFKWIQFWKNTKQYRDDGVWKDNFKNIAFIDNPDINEYKKEFVINDHTTRVPDMHINTEIHISYPLLHFHFVPWKKNQLKQAWYRCSELIAGARNAKRINNTYRITLDPKDVATFQIKPEWIHGLTMPKDKEHISSSWHLDSVLQFFDTYGIEFFEELQIWHIPELHAEFLRRVQREPESKTYPAWLVALNEIKNKVKNFRLKP